MIAAAGLCLLPALAGPSISAAGDSVARPAAPPGSVRQESVTQRRLAQGSGTKGLLAAMPLARSVLYPAYDAATRMTGESFESPSLSRRAENMTLADFEVAVVPGRALLVAAALLKPLGFPPSYTLLEVALLEVVQPEVTLLDRAVNSLDLRANLKVRVDSGAGDGRLMMRLLAPPFRFAAGSQTDRRDEVRFEVVVTEAAQSLRHRFRATVDGVRLIESIDHRTPPESPEEPDRPNG